MRKMMKVKKIIINYMMLMNYYLKKMKDMMLKK